MNMIFAEEVPYLKDGAWGPRHSGRYAARNMRCRTAGCR
jgi:hypothetical protein